MMWQLYSMKRTTIGKDNANERHESLLSDARVQLIFGKDMKKN